MVRTIAPFCSGAQAGMVDRVMRVSQGSGRLPPSDTGSNPQVVLPTSILAGDTSSTIRGTTPMSRETAGVPPSIPITGPVWPGQPRPPSASPSGFPEVRGDAPPPASSARLNIHGGTSVAWGETQVDAPRPGRKRSAATTHAKSATCASRSPRTVTAQPAD